MNILINASNLKVGGGIQVTESVCSCLDRFPQHRFVVVLSSCFGPLLDSIPVRPNVRLVRYDIRNSFDTVVFGRDGFLDKLVEREKIDVVLTVFGPSRWEPRRPHLCGFARPHLVYPDSPYFKTLKGTEKWKNRLFLAVLKYLFRRSTKHLYSENARVSERVEQLFPGTQCATVTNNYHQVFDAPAQWRPAPLPAFEGTTLLTIGAAYAHKNAQITQDIARILKARYPVFRFRFVLTLTEAQFPVPTELADCFVLTGPVWIDQCPDLYRQADIMFQPSLLECFSATYPEAMRMRVPILAADLDFARGLCADAAVYFPPLDASAAADAIYELAKHPEHQEALAAAGERRLKAFDTYVTRVEKLIGLCEQLGRTNK